MTTKATEHRVHPDTEMVNYGPYWVYKCTCGEGHSFRLAQEGTDQLREHIAYGRPIGGASAKRDARHIDLADYGLARR